MLMVRARIPTPIIDLYLIVTMLNLFKWIVMHLVPEKLNTLNLKHFASFYNQIYQRLNDESCILS